MVLARLSSSLVLFPAAKKKEEEKKDGHSGEASPENCSAVWSASWAMGICWNVSEEFKGPEELRWPQILVGSRVPQQQ